MYQIRKSCFETNSSSMHSLIIKKEDNYPPIEKLESAMSIYRIGSSNWVNEQVANKIYINSYNDNDMQFTRYPFKVLTSIKEKLKYYVASECHTENDIEYVKCVLHDIFENIKEINFPDWWGTDKSFPYGYAENYGGFKQALKENNISLKEFLINNKYIIIIDGDEYQEFDELKDLGLINFKEIYKQYVWPDGGYDVYEYDNDGNEVNKQHGYIEGDNVVYYTEEEI